jgi:hypothetical protein
MGSQIAQTCGEQGGRHKKGGVSIWLALLRNGMVYFKDSLQNMEEPVVMMGRTVYVAKQ